MINQETNRSKGYAFIEFTNYKEFQKALNNPESVILGKQKLVFNSAKNRYDYNSHNSNNIINFNDENMQIYNNFNNINYNNYINSPINDNENIRISDDSDNTNSSSINSSNNSAFKIEKNKSNNKDLNNEDIKDNSIQAQIRYALKNMVNFYGKTNPNFCKSKLCNYYCGPFMNKDFFESNRDVFYNCSCSSIKKDIDEKNKNI